MRNRRIPLVKNRIAVEASKGGINLPLLMVMATAVTLLVFYVWMQIQVSAILEHNLDLEAGARILRIEKQKLESEEVRLSKFDRIKDIASEQLGMVAIQRGEIKQVSK